jgi:pyruvate dehydrogenase E2 component (dihydrolipoamide acetyltransferase)
MPSLGADMDEGKLVEWLVKPGDRVARGDLIALVETSKAEVEIELWEDGVVAELVAEPGATIPVGGVLALLETDTPAHPPGAGPTAAEPAAPAPTRTPSEQPLASGPIKASPRARVRARELGVDLATIESTGPRGSVSFEDVERAAVAISQPKKTPRSLRETIAAAMARSKREIPHYYLGLEVDLSHLMTWLTEENPRRAIADRLLPACLLLKAVAVAAAEAPDMNGFFRDGAFEPADAVHLGVAVSLRGGGLVAPALHGADRRPLTELMRDLRDVVNRTRQGRLRASELTAPTLTVTSLGEHGVDRVYGVIHPPQVAIVGYGRIRVVPRAVDGEIVAAPTIDLTLAADHRVSDGLGGAKFLQRIAALLQQPEAL